MTNETQLLDARATYTCVVCDISFTERRSLVRHQRGPAHAVKALLPEYWYFCKENDCSMKFSRKDLFLRHQAEVHAGLKRKASRQSLTRIRKRRANNVAVHATSLAQPLENLLDATLQRLRYADWPKKIWHPDHNRHQKHYANSSTPGREPIDCAPASLHLSRSAKLQKVTTREAEAFRGSHEPGLPQPGQQWHGPVESVLNGIGSWHDAVFAGSDQEPPADLSNVTNSSGTGTDVTFWLGMDLMLNSSDFLSVSNREHDKTLADRVFEREWSRSLLLSLPVHANQAKKAGASQRPNKKLGYPCSWCHDILGDGIEEMLDHLDGHFGIWKTEYRCKSCSTSFLLEADFKYHQIDCKDPTSNKRLESLSWVRFEQYQLESFKHMLLHSQHVLNENANKGCWSVSPGHAGGNSIITHTTAQMTSHSAPTQMLWSPAYETPTSGSKKASQADTTRLSDYHDSLQLGSFLLGAVQSRDLRAIEKCAKKIGNLDCELGIITTERLELVLRPLTLAALSGDLETTQQLLCLHASPASYHYRDTLGTALWAAVFSEQCGIVLQLSKHQDVRDYPIKVDDRDQTDLPGYSIPGVSMDRIMNIPVIDTGLAMAVYQRNLTMTRILLECGASSTTMIHVRLALGSLELPALCYAAYTKDTNLLGLLLSHSRTLPNITSNLGTALSIACGNGDFRSALLLLHYGADPDISDGRQLTPLMEAAKAGELDIITFLVLSGSRHRIRSPLSNTVLIDRQAALGVADSSTAGTTALMIAAKFKQKEAVERLLQLGADVNIQGGCHGSAIAAAAHADSEDIVDLLFVHGAITTTRCSECGLTCKRLTAMLRRGSREHRRKQARKRRVRSRVHRTAITADVVSKTCYKVYGKLMWNSLKIHGLA